MVTDCNENLDTKEVDIKKRVLCDLQGVFENATGKVSGKKKIYSNRCFHVIMKPRNTYDNRKEKWQKKI